MYQLLYKVYPMATLTKAQRKLARAAAAATAPVAATLAAPGPVTLPTQPAVPQVLVVKAGLYYRGARAAWYAVLLAHNGQPGNAYLAACTTQPPSLPKSGRPEAPSGWLRYFVRTGACTLGTPPTP